MLRFFVNANNQLISNFGRYGDFILSAHLAWMIKIEYPLARHLIVTKLIAHAYCEHIRPPIICSLLDVLLNDFQATTPACVNRFTIVHGNLKLTKPTDTVRIIRLHVRLWKKISGL